MKSVTQHHVFRAAIFSMFLALGWRFWQFSQLSFRALIWPYELDYGKGIVWQQGNRLAFELGRKYLPLCRHHYTFLLIRA